MMNALSVKRATPSCSEQTPFDRISGSIGTVWRGR